MDVTNPAEVSDAARIAFWEAQTGRLDWAEPWHTAHRFDPPRVVRSDDENDDGDPVVTPPTIEWFAGGKLNVAVNCVDRHVAAGRGSKVAVHFEGEPGDRQSITYAQLSEQVNRAANMLESLGITAGDRVVIYLPVIPETLVITLACARIGAVHSLVFGGFSAEALAYRIADTGAKLVVTSDGQYRRGVAVPVKHQADEAIELAAGGERSTVEHVLVVRRTSKPGGLSAARPNTLPLGARGGRSNAESAVQFTVGRDVWWHEAMADASPEHEAQAFDAESPLFIMYTSGTTGRPKGLVHTMGGYLVQAAYSFALLFDLLPVTDDGDVDELSTETDPQRRDRTVHWCTADLAWVTAHTYEIYGPLANGVTQVIYEGTPMTPHPGRHLEIIERYAVTNYYTAPTLIRSLMGAFPDGVPTSYNLDSIRLIGTVGEATNPEVWRWFRDEIGGGTAPVIDTWWQTETGSTILSPRPHDARFDKDPDEVGGPKPGCATRSTPGVHASVVNAPKTPGAGEPSAPGEQGVVVVDAIGPAMARTVWGDPQRYADAYWRQFPEHGWFFAGDGGRVDDDGDIWILGRVDDVINVSGHRLSTIEIESALVSHPTVIEAGCAPIVDGLTGHAVAAFVLLREDAEFDVDALRAHVGGAIGPIAKPRVVVPVPDLPRTRSGKIMRRLLTQLWEDTPLGDTTSLQDESSVDRIAAAIARSRP